MPQATAASELKRATTLPARCVWMVRAVWATKPAIMQILPGWWTTAATEKMRVHLLQLATTAIIMVMLVPAASMIYPILVSDSDPANGWHLRKGMSAPFQILAMENLPANLWENYMGTLEQSLIPVWETGRAWAPRMGG